jgi:hypothetical protein
MSEREGYQPSNEPLPQYEPTTGWQSNDTYIDASDKDRREVHPQEFFDASQPRYQKNSKGEPLPSETLLPPRHNQATLEAQLVQPHTNEQEAANQDESLRYQTDDPQELFFRLESRYRDKSPQLREYFSRLEEQMKRRELTIGQLRAVQESLKAWDEPQS